MLHLPVIGDAVRFALVERFCRVLASMAGAGVALPDAMRVATDSLRNLVFMRSLGGVGDAMLHGEGLAVPLAATKLFPSTAARMIRVGEETGTLDDQLEVIARYYESELDYKLKKITSLFEPVDHPGHGRARRLRRGGPGLRDVRGVLWHGYRLMALRRSGRRARAALLKAPRTRRPWGDRGRH